MKTTYILLRNNQESGPHSEEALKTLGLRPDDLIWAEGQSVYWQHPSDFKELQSFISNQPFAPVPLIEEKVVPSIPVIPEYKEVIEEPIYFPEKKKKKLSKPITLIFRPATQNVALYAGLLIAGIAAGIVISKKSNKNNLANASINNTAPASQIKTPAQKTDTTTLQLNSDSASVDSIQAVAPVQTSSTLTISGQSNTERNLAKTNTLTEQKDSQDISKEPLQSVPEKTDPPPVVKDDKPSKSEISSQVSVKTNEYIVAAFGGIRDLELTVKNNSKYPLDKVIVELTYLKPRDEFLRSENISFNDVPAEGKLTIPVQKSNRGVKVTAKVVKVEY